MSKIEELAAQLLEKNEHKNVKSICKQIIKGYKPTRQKDGINVRDLAAWLYVFGNTEDVLAVCEAVSDITFNGNYTIWDCYASVRCFAARVLREQGREEEAKEIVDFLNQYTHPELYVNLKKWFTETLDRNIQSNEEAGRRANANSWRIMKLLQAIQYRELGSSPYTDKELENIIEEMTEMLSMVK